MIFFVGRLSKLAPYLQKPMMMKHAPLQLGLVCLTGFVIGLVLAEFGVGSGDAAVQSTGSLAQETWPTPYETISSPEIAQQRPTVMVWQDMLPDFSSRASEARKLRRQGSRAMKNKRFCAAGMVLRRSFELEPWPREMEYRLDELARAYRQCGWQQDLDDLALIAKTYFPTSYRAYVAERTLNDPDATPARHGMFSRSDFLPLFRVVEAYLAGGDFDSAQRVIEGWRRSLARWASPDDLARSQEIATTVGAPRLARALGRAQRQRFYDSAYNRAWHDRAMRTAHRTTAQRMARRYGVPLALVMGVMRQESAFSTNAQSSAGALGLMQIMPVTGQYLARVPLTEPWDPAVLLEPSTNIALGVKYLSQLQRRFGDLELVLAAYNAGPSAVERWLARRPEDLATFVRTIPYDETRDYVVKVISWMRRFEAAEEERLARRADLGLGEPS